MLQSGQDNFSPGSSEICEGLVPLLSFSPTIMRQRNFGLPFPSPLKPHGDVGPLLSNLTQVRRSVPSNRQHLLRLKSQNPHTFSSSSARLGFGIKEDLVWTINAKVNIAVRSKERLDALLCGPCVPDFVLARVDNRFCTYDSFGILAEHVKTSSQLSRAVVA